MQEQRRLGFPSWSKPLKAGRWVSILLFPFIIVDVGHDDDRGGHEEENDDDFQYV